MIDINLIKNDPKHVSMLLARKGFEVDFTELLSQLNRRRDLIIDVEANKATQNKLSASVPQLKKNGEDVGHIFASVKELAQLNKDKENELAALDEKINSFLVGLPNIPDEDIPSGGKENNAVIAQYNEKKTYDFPISAHVELCESLGLIDYKRGAKISGAGTWIYTNIGAQLEWALLNYFIDEHHNDGYEFILPPHLLNYESGYTAGQFPKFSSDVFWIDSEPAKFMLPTAETALVNLHRNEILDQSFLPKKYYAFTPCYRKEAGSYRTEERGMIRGHQFNKIEMVQYTTEAGSDEAFDELVNKACLLVKKLGLHFQVSKLAAGDCSASMARTYDIEVWIPSMGIYKEISSVSNARSYQARRGMIRYRDNETKKIHFCHTLNASGLATSRLIPAIVEQYQQADGSVIVPEVLRPYMRGLEIIKVK